MPTHYEDYSMNEQEDSFGWGNAATLIGGGLAMTPMGAPLRHNIKQLSDKTGLTEIAKKALTRPRDTTFSLDGVTDVTAKLPTEFRLAEALRLGPKGETLASKLDRPGALSIMRDTYKANRGNPSTNWKDSIQNVGATIDSVKALRKALGEGSSWLDTARKLDTSAEALKARKQAVFGAQNIAMGAAGVPDAATVKSLKAGGMDAKLAKKEAEKSRKARKNKIAALKLDQHSAQRATNARATLKQTIGDRMSPEEREIIATLYGKNDAYKTPLQAAVAYYDFLKRS
jgi:hypothetical protein